MRTLLTRVRWQPPKRCEPKGFGPLFGLECGKQSPSVGFLGAFSLQLSFSVKRTETRIHAIIIYKNVLTG